MQLHPISPTRFSTSRAASLLSPDSHPPPLALPSPRHSPVPSFPTPFPVISVTHRCARKLFRVATSVEFFDAHFTQEIKISVETYAYVKIDFSCARYYFHHKHRIKLSQLEQEHFFIPFYIKNVTFIFFFLQCSIYN